MIIISNFKTIENEKDSYSDFWDYILFPDVLWAEGTIISDKGRCSKD